MGSTPANGSERFTSGELFGTIWNYLELFGTIWNYVVWAAFLQANGSERFTNIPANHLELNVFCLYDINIFNLRT